MNFVDDGDYHYHAIFFSSFSSSISCLWLLLLLFPWRWLYVGTACISAVLLWQTWNPAFVTSTTPYIMAENTAVTTHIVTIAATNPNAADPITYSITSVAGSGISTNIWNTEEHTLRQPLGPIYIKTRCYFCMLLCFRFIHSSFFCICYVQ